VPNLTNPKPSSEEKCKIYYYNRGTLYTLLTTWGITLTLLNELSFNVGHNTYITKHQHYELGAYTYTFLN